MLQELSILKDQNASVYMTFWELFCYFHIGIDITGSKGAFEWHKKLVEYFFAILDGQELVSINSKPSVEQLKKHLD